MVIPCRSHAHPSHIHGMNIPTAGLVTDHFPASTCFDQPVFRWDVNYRPIWLTFLGCSPGVQGIMNPHAYGKKSRRDLWHYFVYHKAGHRDDHLHRKEPGTQNLWNTSLDIVFCLFLYPLYRTRDTPSASWPNIAPMLISCRGSWTLPACIPVFTLGLSQVFGI